MEDLIEFGFAEGNYVCICYNCNKEFIGDKRSIHCKECATIFKNQHSLSVVTRTKTEVFFMTDNLRTLIFDALGKASMCWEFPKKAGIFQSERAEQIGLKLLEEINDILKPDYARK